MSVQALTWSFGVVLRDVTAKAALNGLANYANEDGSCWPSIETLARGAGCSVSTMHRAVERLIKYGLLERTERAGRSYLFRLKIGSVPLSDCYPCQSDTPVSLTPHPCQSDTPTPVRVTGDPCQSDTLTIKEPLVEPLRNRQEITDEAVTIYNSVAEQSGWAKVQRVTDRRKSSLAARLKECGGIDGWQAAMERAGASRFLSGKLARSHGFADWRPNFDWFINASNFAKLMEGTYDNRAQSADPDERGLGAVLAAIGRYGARGD